MLLCKNCRRYKECHLLIVINCLKCRPYGNLRLSVTYITTDKSVHYLVTFHIFLGCSNRIKLILCFLKRKHIFKFLLPHCIRTELISFYLLALCVEKYKFFGNFIYRFFYPALCLFPLNCIELIKLWNFHSIMSRVFLKDIKP